MKACKKESSLFSTFSETKTKVSGFVVRNYCSDLSASESDKTEFVLLVFEFIIVAFFDLFLQGNRSLHYSLKCIR